MERTIIIEPLQKRFTLEMKDANKAARNRSYANASNCCGEKLKQEKKCGKCGEAVNALDCTRKIIKLGKEEHLIDASALEQVHDILESQEEISVFAFLCAEPIQAKDRYDGLLYAFPIDKKEQQYKELAALLDGRTAVGKGVFGQNEYQIMLSIGDDGVIRVRKLVEESQRYSFNPLDVEESLAGVPLSDEIVVLEKKILDTKMQSGFDITEFRDKRAEFEEKIIEDFVLNGTVPEVKQSIDVQQQQSEMERLNALLMNEAANGN